MEDIKILTPIVKNGIRIFRPNEVDALIKAIPKIDHKDKFEALLYTGCRYNELRWLWKHFHAKPENAFNGNTIKMISLKPEAVHADRYIHLNNNGIRAVDHFLRSKRNLPAHPGWDENLLRWSKKAKINPKGICCKATRKTWESWLVTMYQSNFHNICLSQGHTDKVSLDYYLMLPFSDDDKKEIRRYTEGWL
jgi:hypothetical protein